MKKSARSHHRLSLSVIILISIILLASVPRVIEVLNGNYLFGFDQGKQWLGAKALIVDHKIPLIGDEVGGARGFFQGPGWIYLLSVFYVLFNGNPYGGIFLMFISGITTVGLGVWLFGKAIGRLEGAMIGLFLAISPILIESSRFTWPPHIIPPLTVIILYCLWRVLEDKFLYLPILFFFVSCMAHFEIATAGTFSIALLVFLIPFAFFKKIPLKWLLLTAVAWCLPFTPLVIFDIRHQFINTKGILATFGGNRQFAKSLMALTENHYMIFTSAMSHAFQTLYTSIFAVILFFILGLFQFKDKTVTPVRRQFVGFLYAFPFVLFGICTLYKNDMWPWWLYELAVIVVVSFALAVSWLMKKKGILRVLSILLTVLMLSGFIKESMRFWKYDYPDYGGVYKIRGKEDALDYIYKDAKGYPFGLYVFSPPIYTYPYDFLIWWYGTKKYGYYPPQKELPVFYLLAEPDPEKPWTYKGWMETAIKEGTAVSRITLPSGFIVEKRTMP